MKRTMHPNSLANLEKGKIKKGQITNPKGRPRNELSITAKQREMLALPCPYAPGKTWLEWLADRGMALAGENATYYRELMDRLEGKVLQPVGGEDGKPIEVLIDYRGKMLSAISRHADRSGEGKDTEETQP